MRLPVVAASAAGMLPLARLVLFRLMGFQYRLWTVRLGSVVARSNLAQAAWPPA